MRFREDVRKQVANLALNFVVHLSGFVPSLVGELVCVRMAVARFISLDETHPDNNLQPRHVVEDFTSPIPAEAALNDELHARVEEAIRDLPEKQRTSLLLCREGGVSYEEIAVVLGGISLTAVKSIIFRGRAVLKARLKPYLKSGDWQKK